MTFSSALNQLLYRGSNYDATRDVSQGGYVKRVTPSVAIGLPVTAVSDPTGTNLAPYYENTGTAEGPVWTRKSSVSFTYTAPTGSKVVGPGSITTPAASITDDLVLGADRPAFVVFVANDGSEFLLNLSKPDVAGGSPGPTDTGAELSVPHVPVDRTLLAHLLSDGWQVGASADFESARSSSNIW